jgi:8-oxo-dGTP pyrophosphatase MutT (NUDIX family)
LRKTGVIITIWQPKSNYLTPAVLHIHLDKKQLQQYYQLEMSANTNTMSSHEVAGRLSHSLIDAVVAQSWERRDFRPVAVAAITDQLGRFLLVESAKQLGEWGLVQGGIDPGESVDAALTREAAEEVGIRPADLTIGGVTEITKSKIPNGHSQRRGFSDGKLYVVERVLYTGDGTLTLDPAEVNDAVWAAPDQVEKYIANKRPEKAELIRRALATDIVLAA